MIPKPFSEIAEGECFFDPVSGETMRKINSTTAQFLTGGDYILGTSDRIEPAEMVEPCEEPQ